MIPTGVRPFFDQEELDLADQFLDRGHVIVPVDKTSLGVIRQHVADAAVSYLDMIIKHGQGDTVIHDPDDFLNNIHNFVSPEQLNGLRLCCINAINSASWMRQTYFGLARRHIEILVGNELSMQRRLNLNIQMPNDTSSLLAVHGDVWTGDSPYELVMWLPLIDCYKTKSMYVIPSVKKDREIQAGLAQHGDTENLFSIIEPHVEFLKVDYGQALLFCQNNMHGNRINTESETRWSMNCRFKSILTPHADKKLGEFFEPITMRPVTRMGAEYQLPKGFEE